VSGEGQQTAGETEPTWTGGYPVWSARAGDVEVRFVGRGDERSRADTLAAVEPGAPPVAALRQVHSATLVAVDAPGFHGEGDALATTLGGLALSVITADCVPLLLATGNAVAAVHAGWRGVAAGVVARAAASLGSGASGRRAWIGPAIDACCYEVGEEVAGAVVAASDRSVATPGPRGRPHLDLRRAVALQLTAMGWTVVTQVGPCTRCTGELLWSYRRDGKAGGRNLAFVWRRGAGARSVADGSPGEVRAAEAARVAAEGA
jgi:YfiH family protein